MADPLEAIGDEQCRRREMESANWMSRSLRKAGILVTDEDRLPSPFAMTRAEWLKQNG